MIYIYDILLNFNEKLLEFFEWEDNDDIKYVKKVPVFNVDSKVISDFINYKVKIKKSFSNLIYNKVNVYDEEDKLQEIAIISDGKIAIGIMINNNEVIKLSRLLLDEELDVLKLVGRIPETTFSYEILEKVERKNNNLTRNEQFIMNNLKKEFKNFYDNNMIDKLNYFYYEYFNERSNDKDHVYHALIDSIDNDFNDKHRILYDMIKLSYNNNINI